MTALELHRQNPSLDLAPILRVIKYMGFDSNSLAAPEIDQILRLYPHFERDPELVVGIEAVCRLTDLETGRLSELLGKHRHEIPYLGTTAHPMVPKVAIDMIRAIADGDDPMSVSDEELFTLTEMAEQTDISLASLSKYVKEQPERVPSRTVGRMRKFPRDAIAVFQQIKAENMGRRGNGKESAQRQKAAVTRRYAAKLADLEEQLDTAVEVSRELSRTLNRLSGQVRRARAAAESDSNKKAEGSQTRGARRSGGHRPDTIVAACKQILAQADGEMRVAEITERVIAMGTPIKAKNPNVTVSSILSSYDDFARVRRGYYELIRKDEELDGSPAATGTNEQSAVDSAGATRETASVERDPEEVLAGLQAAAESAEATTSDEHAPQETVEAPADDACTATPQAAPDGRRKRRRPDGMIRLEPSEAAG